MIHMSRKTVVSGLIVLCALVIGAVPVFGQVAFQTSFPNSKIRPEGQTEQLGPLVFTSTSGPGAKVIKATSTITVTFNATVNVSGVLNCVVNNAGVNAIVAPATSNCVVAAPGTNNITFGSSGPNVTITFVSDTTVNQGDTLSISGVRIDASLVGPNSAVTANISANAASPSTNSITFTQTSANVATTVASTLTVVGVTTSANVLTCAVPSTTGATAAIFSVKATENLLGGLDMAILAEEPGATVSTTVRVVVTGVPLGLAVAPTAVTFPALQVSLTFGAAVPLTTTSTGPAQLMTFDFPVTADNISGFEIATFNFTVGLPSGAAGSITAINTTNTLTAQIFLAGAAASTSIGTTAGTALRFASNQAPQPASPIKVATIGDCVTYLLFPFVTNGSGYDTIINISNSTNDDAALGVGIGATNQSGACTMSFYGSSNLIAATVGTATSFPMATTGAPATAVIVPPGGTFSIQASTIAAMANQSGYLFANCGFLNAHGFSWFMNSTSPTTAAFSTGFLALVIQNPVGVRQNAAGQFESLTN